MADERFYLHTSNKLENLADVLLEVVESEPLEGLLALETVMSLNSGMARWLRLRIAQETGIAMNWDFPFPAKAFARLLSGLEPGFEEHGQYEETSARWFIHAIFNELDDSPKWSLVKRYCEEGSSLNRLQLAMRMAYLYDQYLIYRPDLISGWEMEKEPTEWQGSLWKMLTRAMFDSPRPPHIARLWHNIQSNRYSIQEIDTSNWPQRLSVFGISSLPPLYLDLLKFCSHFIPIHLFVLQPTDLYWADLRTKKQVLKASQKKSENKRSEQPIFSEQIDFDAGNPLLPAFGRQSQMFLDLLIDRDPQHNDSAFSEPEPSSQLASLQRDMFFIRNRSLEEDQIDKEAFPAFDGSIEIHNCHSPRREIESLRDYIIKALHDDSSLSVSDFIVMAPDIQKYAPSIESVFEMPLDGTELKLPYSIADESRSKQSSLAMAFVSVLSLPETRITSIDILRIIEHNSIRDRFRFSQQDLKNIKNWIRQSGVTWGWDADMRGARGAFATDRSTWREFRQRLGAGLALSSSKRALRLGVIPISGLEGDQASLAGRFLAFLSMINQWIIKHNSNLSLNDWRSSFADLLESIFFTTIEQESGRRIILDTIQEAFPATCNDVSVTGKEATYLLIRELERESSRSGFLSGNITFCSLKPMRSLPAKIVCLLGLNHDAFPRRTYQDSLDLQKKQRRLGDRNPKEEDKQLFLEALLSARQRLRISYCGMSPVSDTVSPPSQVVAELMNYIDDAMKTSDSGLIDDIVFNHKRQPYDETYFSDERFFTYSQENAETINTLMNQGDGESLDEIYTSVNPVAASSELDSISIADFVARFTRPQKTFLQKTKQVRFYSEEEEPEDIDCLKLDGLRNYLLKREFANAIGLEEALDSVTQSWLKAAKLLPPGKLGDIEFSDTLSVADTVARNWQGITRESAFVNTRVRIDGKSVSIFGNLFLDINRSKQAILLEGAFNARRMISCWIQHVMACKFLEEARGEPVASLIASIAEPEKMLEFSAPEDLSEHWNVLIKWFRSSLETPLEFFPETSYRYAANLFKLDLEQREGKREEALRSATLHLKNTSAYSVASVDWDVYCDHCFDLEYLLGETFESISSELLFPLFANLKTLSREEIFDSVGTVKQ